jgi:hypothetical protein
MNAIRLYLFGLRFTGWYQWCERVIYCHHNARVLADLEYRMSVLLCEATDVLSKPHYNIDVMTGAIAEKNRRVYREGYDDAKEEAKHLETLVDLADKLRTAQRAYMADRGNDELGKAVAAASAAYDSARNPDPEGHRRRKEIA